MKKTEYFISKTYGWSGQIQAKDDVILQRNLFLQNSIQLIEEIVDEDLSFNVNPSANQIFAVIKITYYAKSN